jgi:hypothetical protein
MKKNNRLTPEVYKEILELAGTLPVMYRTGANGKVLMPMSSKLVKGSEIEGKLSNGDDPNPNKNYVQKQRQPLTVNHAVEMIDLYKTKGITAVKNYAGQVFTIAKQAEEAKQAKQK